jgi:hypothetical protein
MIFLLAYIFNLLEEKAKMRKFKLRASDIAGRFIWISLSWWNPLVVSNSILIILTE